MVVTLEEAVEIALEHNDRLQISETGLKIAEAQLAQAKSANYPKVDLSLSASRMDEDPNFHVEGSIELPRELAETLALSGAHNKDLLGIPSPVPGASWFDLTARQISEGGIQAQSLPFETDMKIFGRDTATAQIDVTYPLYTGGKVSSVIRQASLNRNIKSEEIRRSRAEVIYDTRRYYYAVILAERVRDEIADTLESLKTVRDLTESFYRGASLRVKKTDYLRTLVTVDLATSMYEESRSGVETAKAALVNAMGLPWDTEIEVARKDFPTPVEKEDMARLVEKAYRFNPEYARIRLAVDLSDARIEESRSGYLPQIGLQANASHFQNSLDSGFDTPENRNTWTIGIGLRWNIFNGFFDREKIEEAKLEKKRTEHAEILLKKGIALQVKAAFLQLDRARRQFEALRQARDHASENADLHIRAYRAEMVETKDVLEAQLMEAFTKSAYYKSRHDYALNRALLDFILTRSLEERD